MGRFLRITDVPGVDWDSIDVKRGEFILKGRSLSEEGKGRDAFGRKLGEERDKGGRISGMLEESELAGLLAREL
jgi:hypothetical protein